MNKRANQHNGGYVAIASVLVILTVTLVITLSASMLSIDGAQVSLSENQGQKAMFLVDSCVSEALLYLNENNSLPASVSLPEGSCTVTQDSQSGDNWVFSTSGSVNGFSRMIQVDIDRNTTIQINRWEEV